MKTSVIEVRDMLSVLSLEEVEKRIGEVPSVESVTVNYAASSATVRYDETRLEVADIKSAVCQRGHEAAAPAIDPPGDSHVGHNQADTLPAAPVSAPPASAPDTAVAATLDPAVAESKLAN